MQYIPTQMSERQYLSRREVAEEYGFSKRFLEALASAGRGPAMIRATARKVLYRRIDVEAWLESLRVEPKSISPDKK
jgi:predicted DNA-binding transcriptional regulator AlpA